MRIRYILILSAPVLFQLMMIVNQYLQPGYNPIRDTISSLVWGYGGWIQTVNFYLFGILLMFFAVKFFADKNNKVSYRASGILLLLIGLGFIILGICPTQSPGAEQTVQSIIHGVTVYCIIILFPTTCFVLASVLRNETYPRFLFIYTCITGTLNLAFILLGAFFAVSHEYWFGMVERLIILNGFAWIEVIGIQVWGRSSIRAIEQTRPV